MCKLSGINRQMILFASIILLGTVILFGSFGRCFAVFSAAAAPCFFPFYACARDFQNAITQPVGESEMRSVYEDLKTPYKYGVVVRPPKGMLADSPSVFKNGDKWYMYYILQDGSGYSTHIAESADLLEWKYLGEILKRKNNSDWDGQQSAAYAALQDHNFGGSCALAKFDGKYWVSYLGGALKGYETDPLAIGIAFADNPIQVGEWNRLPRPVLSPGDADSRYFEKLTLYKSNIIYDAGRTLGSPFVMFYNAKTDSGYERIALAVSEDMKNWKRFGSEPVVDNGSGIVGDPQVVKMGDIWVMLYFVAGPFGEGGRAIGFDTFACSRDLVNWVKWKGEALVKPGENYDKTFAHKPWVVKHNGIVYHFYCAVGNEGRVIALATSRDLRK